MARTAGGRDGALPTGDSPRLAEGGTDVEQGQDMVAHGDPRLPESPDSSVDFTRGGAFGAKDGASRHSGDVDIGGSHLRPGAQAE